MITQSNDFSYFVHMARGAESARQYIESLTRAGQYFFSSDDAREALGVSAAAAKVALHRLSQQGLVSSPARGYYVACRLSITRSAACPPSSSSPR